MPIARIPYVSPPSKEEASAVSTGLGRPMLFQVTQVGTMEPLWPYLLALHVNPSTLTEQFNKSKNVVMTRGGFVEFVWPDDLDTLSAESSTGAFIGPDSGLTSDSANPSYRIGRGAGIVRPFRGRHGTIAWERAQDLLELFRQNGQIFGGSGSPALRSQIMCMYDRGIFFGWFTSFEVTETGDLPYQFKLNWEFKVTQTVYTLPFATQLSDYEEPPSASEAESAAKGEATTVADVEEFLRNKRNNDEPVDPAVDKILQSTANREALDSWQGNMNTNTNIVK